MGEMVTMLVLWLVVIGVMWFLLMRPQKKEQKRIQQMLASMEVGDTALTTSGFYGVIIDITDEDVIVEFGNIFKILPDFFKFITLAREFEKITEYTLIFRRKYLKRV